MKIGDIEIGKEYGAHDEPARSYSGSDPRQVRVLEVVIEETPHYSRYTTGTAPSVRKNRRLKVEVLDAGPVTKPSYIHDRKRIRSADKGETLVIESRHVVGLWKDLNPDITKRRNTENARLEAEHALQKRVLDLVGGKPDWSRFTLDARGPHPSNFEVEFKGATLQKILTYAEKGKEVIDAQ